MQHQVQSLPGRTVAMAAAQLELHERAARAYDVATSDLDRTPAHFRKARALSQTPSLLERLFVEVLELRKHGARTVSLRAIPLELQQLIRDLDQDGTPDRVEDLLREAMARENAANPVEMELAMALEDPRALRELARAYRAEIAIKEQAAARAEERARELQCGQVVAFA